MDKATKRTTSLPRHLAQQIGQIDNQNSAANQEMSSAARALRRKIIIKELRNMQDYWRK